MSPFTLTALALILLVLFLHLRELRALRFAVGTLAARVPPAPPLVPAPIPATPAPARLEPEPVLDRDSTEALTQVMHNPLKPPAEQPSSRPAQIAAGLARPRSQRSPASSTSAKAPHPPPVKVGPPKSAPPPPLPPVSPPPRPRTGTLPSMPAQEGFSPRDSEDGSRT